MQESNIIAATPYYGPTPQDLSGAPNIRANVLAFYGALDTRVTGGWPQMEDALKTAGVQYQAVIEPDAAHAFFNDTGQSYNAAAAADAWPKTLAWLHDNLPQM
jgi:carboxymethylenebutenolidase